MGDHEAVVRELTEQAENSADPRLHVGDTRHLGRLVEFIEPELDLEDVVLDVACGTGLLSRAIARRVRHVTALDITPAAIDQGKREADQEGVTNVTFTLGDATDLPHAGRSFTLVLTRFSLHHVGDPREMVSEMVRVSRPGAGIVIAEIVRPEGGADPDRLERLRDPAYRGTLTAEAISDMLGEAGAEVRRTASFDVVRPVGPWLEHARTPAEVAARIVKELEAELAGGPATGMRPLLSEGELCFTHTHAFLAAVAP